ncbi:MAG: hypothetical protein MUF06_05110 [Pirellulaceae bacterium]|jgi:hypothetical protein|nr:hypothetical protein [Pirellulaceae bacterium]
MSSKKPAGLFGGLILEIGLVILVVSLLPKLPLGQAAGRGPAGKVDEIADRRPSLAPPPEPLTRESVNWRAAVGSAPPTGEPVIRTPQRLADAEPLLSSGNHGLAPLPPVDPAYVEQRLDRAGQMLLDQMNSLLTRQAERLLDVPREGSFPTDGRPFVLEPADARPSMYRAPVVPAYPR